MNIFDFIGEEEIKKLSKIQDHPLVKIANIDFSLNKEIMQIKQNLDESLNEIYKCETKYQSWLKKIKLRLTNPDISTASSAFGEIRTLAILLKAGFTVKAINDSNKESTPDFQLKNGNEVINIEVFTKNVNDKENKRLQDFYLHKKPNKESEEYKNALKLLQALNLTDEERHEYLSSPRSMIVFSPFGVKGDASDQEIVISNICSIKKDEHQFAVNTPSILWIDLQSEHISTTLHHTLAPYEKFNEVIYANPIWYAFYGKKGLPIIIGKKNIINCVPKMKHDGRFSVNNMSKIDCSIISFHDALFILENPNSNKLIPNWFMDQITKLNIFNNDCSFINTEDKSLTDKIRRVIEDIESLNK